MAKNTDKAAGICSLLGITLVVTGIAFLINVPAAMVVAGGCFLVVSIVLFDV